MKKSDKNLFFTKYNEKEKSSKIRQLVTSRPNLKIWQKGERIQISASPRKRVDDSSSVYLFSTNMEQLENLISKDVLFNFELSNMNVFGTGTLSEDGNDIILNLTGDLFKCERRQNFRLAIHSNNNVRAIFSVDSSLLKEKEKILDYSRNKTADKTQLFKDFVKLVGTSSSKKIVELNSANSCSFSVIDISASGIAIKVSEYERVIFDETKKLPPFTVQFNTEYYLIPGGTAVYIVDYVDPIRTGLRLFKVGIEFNPLNEVDSSRLTRQINREVRPEDIEKEFEDFVG